MRRASGLGNLQCNRKNEIKEEVEPEGRLVLTAF